MKYCNKCENLKSKDSFGKDISRKDGLAHFCKKCIKHYHFQNYKKNKQQILERNKEWANKNKEQISKTNKKNAGTLKGRYTFLKSIARRREMEVDLTLEEYSILIQDIGVCYICFRGDFLSSYGYCLDRIDNNKGYTFDNCMPCCWECNKQKALKLGENLKKGKIK